MMLKFSLHALALLLTLLLGGCSDGSDSAVGASAEARVLRQQFGAGAEFFTDAGVQALLDFEDTASPVTLLQLMSVTDSAGLARYDTEAAALWQSVGAHTRFSSSVFAQLIGERALVEVRAIEFPNIYMLIDAMGTDAFGAAMDTLFAASDDHAWVLGIATPLPFEPTGSYFDPALQKLDREQAIELLNSGTGDLGIEAARDVLVDMLVSDDPSPFWMINLIKFYDQANYGDDRDSQLTGIEANAIYGQAIVPMLLAYNSFPEIAMPISVVLTAESVNWQQAVIVRYASRDAFLNIYPLNPLAGAALEHKEAGVEETLVYASAIESANLPVPVDGFLYNFRYCEVLLARFEGNRIRADVYNSIGLSTCPQAQWDALDAVAIAGEYDTDAAVLNGIRFWVLDRIENNQVGGGEPVVADFGGIRMRLAASVLAPEGAFPGQGGDVAYQIARVDRDTLFHYSAGRQVYELADPDGNRYMMQSFSRVIDKDLQLGELQSLGQRLQLPQGWSFSTRVLAADFALPTVDGVAEVVTDALNNTYQRVP